MLLKFWTKISFLGVTFLCTIAGKGFGGFSKVFVACHRSSETLVVVKQTNVDVQNARQLEELKVCINDIVFFNKKVILIQLKYQLLIIT